ncbi:MAG TPA: glycosyltransferase family 1 protein [Terriglobia bacterium]|nr:glycosyltransferase family 1 protein [Terriglobia bacterium]
MKVGLNISAASGAFTGVGNYAFQLARAVISVAPEDEWIFFGTDAHLAPLLNRVNARPMTAQRTGLARILWEQAGLLLEARREKLDLLHGVDFSRPLAYRGRMVNTIHDLSPFADGQYIPWARRAYVRTLMSNAARRGLAVITVSEFSRRQIIERFCVDEERVFAIAHGVITNGNGAARSKSDAPYLLFVGNLEHRKNLVRLVKAFRLLRDRRRIPHRLVLCGRPGHGWGSILAAIEKEGVQNDIDLPGYLRDDGLARMYRSADLFVFPSVYEGFGLPVLEAMACGTPVVCSNATSLPEVGGDAVEYFDPYSVEDLAAAIERALDSPTRQAEMRERGLRQAGKFTWEECARKHVEVYRRVLFS